MSWKSRGRQVQQLKTARDPNEQEIVNVLRAVGASVMLLDRPLDLLVGYRGVTHLLEVKMPVGARGGCARNNQKLSPAQLKFIDGWRGARPEVVRTPEQALRAIGYRGEEG